MINASNFEKLPPQEYMGVSKFLGIRSSNLLPIFVVQRMCPETPCRDPSFVQQVKSTITKSVSTTKTKTARHVLIDSQPFGFGDKEIRPDCPYKGKTPKDEANVAAEIRFVGIDPWLPGRE